MIKLSNKVEKAISEEVNNLLNYKVIFGHNKKKDNSVLLLKKIEYDVFYSCKQKYPLLVAENITLLTGKTDPNNAHIDRRLITDPFREDMDIPTKYRHTLEDYKVYMEYGGSMGHNAPAGQHKTNLNIYYETFLLSNITPQEMVFNSGLWVLMENWCKYIAKYTNIMNIRVFTGSIPEEKPHNFNGVKMNVPLKMFKIICYEMETKPGITFLEILIANNTAYYVNPNSSVFDLTPFLVPIKSLEWFQNFTGISINKLLEYYGYPTQNIKSFRNHISMKITLSPALKQLMKKSNWFGHLIYATSINNLEYKWEQCKKFEKEFETLIYHQQFYDLTKKRLLRDNNNTCTIVKLNEKSFQKTMINTQRTQRTHLTKHKTKTILSKKKL